MNILANRSYLAGAALALMVAVSTGCSESSTKPKETPAYPNAALLVSGASLEGNLSAANTVIVDTRAAADYAAGHVPNAINLPITPGGGLFDKGGDGIDNTDLKPASELAAAFGGAGITQNTTIIIYGANIDTFVGRMFWMLEYIGATDVRMLDGGIAKWNADARQLSTTPKTLAAVTFTPTVNSSIEVTKEEMLEHYDDTDEYIVVDSRNAEHFTASRIPNAVNILTGDFLNTDLTVKPSVEIDAIFTSKGITKDKFVYTHCYVGYRSSQEYFVFRLMGYDVAHYDGSWTEWNADPLTPKVSGN